MTSSAGDAGSGSLLSVRSLESDNALDRRAGWQGSGPGSGDEHLPGS
jgi:hypothetical protein